MPWGPFLPVKFERSWAYLAVSPYANMPSPYSLFGSQFANLTSVRPILTKAARAQVVELVDALASGASGLTAVKVRVLSWAPFARAHDFAECGLSGPSSRKRATVGAARGIISPC